MFAETTNNSGGEAPMSIFYVKREGSGKEWASKQSSILWWFEHQSLTYNLQIKYYTRKCLGPGSLSSLTHKEGFVFKLK